MSKRKLKGVADATRASLSQVEVVESEERELYAHVRAYIASARETVYAVANSAEFGPGYTRSSLRTMRQFYLMFPICHAVSGKLTWTHYRTLITVENDAARQYYFEEAAIEETMALRALPPQEPKKKSVSRKASKGGRR